MHRTLVLPFLCTFVACASTTNRMESARPAPLTISPSAPPDGNPALGVWHFLRERYDADGDGRILRGEYTRSAAGFERLDADRDGLVSAADFDARFDGEPRTAGEAFVYGEGGPGVGAPAPDFSLRTTGGENLSLAALRAERPVVLVFGSFT